ncbi:hypothetical protein [Planktothricoides raciborskii]|uniref:Uncharacterized protein n=1 Tax=Planktothricoides raciborskii FACHB-1370 TaxID=2949576 RepID=A0ABR8E9G7_9CYAN|nr:hypothetical protein [Planktothricoides raciborskii]MBD2542818.1 hypothetical protein [Planktothricoides raciborskii FACHB-1370]MBD2581435.1 hypothetical protein [Planktothricoides raciborskii FACHB-1261]
MLGCVSRGKISGANQQFPFPAPVKTGAGCLYVGAKHTLREGFAYGQLILGFDSQYLYPNASPLPAVTAVF